MLNYLWAFMILAGILYGGLTGNIEAVTNGALDSAKEAISLCITMLGVLSMWTGLMEIATKSGIMERLTKAIAPFVRFLFPRIPKGHKSLEYITTNIVANILGLGWAATPPGLRAMEELETLRGQEASGIATDEMCTFLVINISSLQLIPMNMIAYRSQYGSVNPTLIVGPAIVATLISTLAGIVFCKCMCNRNRR
jgi:spore maturation protein A